MKNKKKVFSYSGDKFHFKKTKNHILPAFTSQGGCDSKCISITGPTGATGADGQSGISAYQVAVNEGFIGNQAEWLESLVGKNGSDEVKGSVVPFGVSFFSTKYEDQEVGQIYDFSIIGFSIMLLQEMSVGFPYSFTSVTYEPGVALTVTNDTLLDTLSASFMGNVNNLTLGSELFVALYISDPESLVYNYLPQSNLSLGVVNSLGNNTDIILEGSISNINTVITAGSKIMLIVYTQNSTGVREDNTIYYRGVFFGGLGLKDLG